MFFVDFPSNGYKICYAVMLAVKIILIILRQCF